MAGKSKGAVSAGERNNVRKDIRNELRREYLASGNRLRNQWKAFSQNKRVMVTIPNPNKGETNKPFIRVTAQEAGWKKQEPFKMKQEG